MSCQNDVQSYYLHSEIFFTRKNLSKVCNSKLRAKVTYFIETSFSMLENNKRDFRLALFNDAIC